MARKLQWISMGILLCVFATPAGADPTLETSSGSITVKLTCIEAKDVFQRDFVERNENEIAKALDCQTSQLEFGPIQQKSKMTFGDIKPKCGAGSEIFCSKDFGKLIGTTKTAPSAE